MTATQDPVSERLVGSRVLRKEDPRLLTGNARFIADIALPRTCHVAFVRSPFPHARIEGLVLDQARSHPGVVAVFSGRDFAPVVFEDVFVLEGLRKTPQGPLAVDKVRFVGEPVAMVLAGSRAVAEDAAELVQVEYAELPVHVDVEESAKAKTDLLFDHLDSNLVLDLNASYGDPEGAFAEADHVVELRYRSNRYMAAPLECAGIIASHEKASNELQVWASTQSAHLIRWRIAAATNIPEHQIRVHIPDTGGGFGQKIPIRAEEAAVAMAATRVDRPVKWIEDRYENLVAGPHARDQVVYVELAVNTDGQFQGIRARFIGDGGAYSHNSASALIEPYHASSVMTGAYKFKHYAFNVTAALTNKSPVAPYRGVGFTAAQTARELAIDKAARFIGMDPVELRLRNMITSAELPYETCSGMVYDSGSYEKSVHRAREMLDYEGFRERQANARKEGRLLGIGITPFVEPTGWGTEGARQTGRWSSFVSHDAADVRMDSAANVTLSIGLTSQGQGHETAFCQIVGDQLGLPLHKVRLIANDTAVMPMSTPGTRASRGAVVAGGAVWRAAEELREKLLLIASVLMEADVQDLELVGGQVGVIGSPSSRIPLARVAEAAHRNIEVREVVPEPHLSVTRFYDPGATYTDGCFGAIVEIDPETAQVTVEQLVVVEDCGRMINPMIVDGQVRGGMAQGLGGALLEQILYDDHGEIKTSTLMDYLLPTATDVPHIRVDHYESPSPMTIGGIKGMGESGSMGTPAVIACAVADVLAPYNVDVTETPLLPHRIAALLPLAEVITAHEEDDDPY